MDCYTIFKKEFKSYLNSPIAYVVIIAFLLINGWFFTSNFFLINQAEVRAFFEVTPFIFLFFAPAITMKLFAEEKKSGTIELLTTLPLKDRDILTGKYLAALALLSTAVLLTFSYPISASLLGNMDSGQTVAGYIGIILMGGVFLSIGIFASSITSNQIVAFIVVFLLSFILFMLGKVLAYVPGFLVTLFEFISMDYHFQNSVRGVLDSRDVFYCLSMIFLFLMLTDYSIKNQRFKHKSHSFIVLACVTGIIALLNMVSLKVFFRVDLTEDKIYTLSKASRDLMKGLDDTLLIKAYFSKNLPHPHNNNVRFLKDKLDEFKIYSNGNLKYEFVDPAGNKELERELFMMGIPAVKLTNIKSDKYEIKKGYMGLAMFFEDRKEAIPIISGTTGLEYDIVSALKKVTRKNSKTIGFLIGHGEPEIREGLQGIAGHLRQQYDIREVNMKDGKPVSDDIDFLVIAGTQKMVSEREKYQIDQFLMSGRPIAFFIDKIKTDFNKFQTSSIANNLDDLLEHYGVKINHDLILDIYNRRIKVRQRSGYRLINNSVNYPLFPLFKDFNSENPIVNKLETVFLPFASSLELRNQSQGEDVTLTSLIKSSQKSWRQTGNFKTNPLDRFSLDTSQKGPFIVAAAATGEFKSFYAGKEIPGIDKESPEDAKITRIDEDDDTKITIEKSPPTRIIVVGDSDFIKNEIPIDKRNLPFIMNMMDWLVQDEGLISMRSRGVTDRPLEEITDFKKSLVKYVNIFGVSLVLIGFGLIRWKIRRLGKKEVWI